MLMPSPFVFSSHQVSVDHLFPDEDFIRILYDKVRMSSYITNTTGLPIRIVGKYLDMLGIAKFTSMGMSSADKNLIYSKYNLLGFGASCYNCKNLPRQQGLGLAYFEDGEFIGRRYLCRLCRKDASLIDRLQRSNQWLVAFCPVGHEYTLSDLKYNFFHVSEKHCDVCAQYATKDYQGYLVYLIQSLIDYFEKKDGKPLECRYEAGGLPYIGARSSRGSFRPSRTTEDLLSRI